MTKTTMTGIPIEMCGLCGHEHPITRDHCVSCSSASLFLDPESGLCVPCGQLPNQTDIFDQLKEVPR